MSTSSKGSSVDPQVLVENIFREWRFSSPTERLFLAFYFRSFHDLIARSFRLRFQLISDAKRYLEENKSGNRSIRNFCQAILWNHQRLRIERPIVHIAARGGPEVLPIVLSQLRSMMPVECLRVLQQFPNYRDLAKRHPVLRSLVMRHARYSTTVGDSTLNYFSSQLFQEFKAYDMHLEPHSLFVQLRRLKTEDLLMDIACNEYHLVLVSSCRFTSYRVMMCFSDIFPNLDTLNDLQCLQLRVDRLDKYLERIFYRDNQDS